MTRPANRPSPVSGPRWSADGGLAFLGSSATALFDTVDDTIVRWAGEIGAEPRRFPPLIRADALHRLDVFSSFPHLGVLASRIRPDRLADYSEAADVGIVPAADLADSGYLLPSAACYGVYLHLTGSTLDEPVLVTTAAQCFRNETEYDGLRRLWGFTMREIVCVGSAEAVRAHLDRHHDVLGRFVARLGLSLARKRATDPFFKKNDPREFLQRIDPLKEEYVWADGTAVASMNYHRNFFGERCGISYQGGPAFTGCVAFGLERWVHVLAAAFGGDLGAAREAVLAAGEPE